MFGVLRFKVSESRAQGLWENYRGLLFFPGGRGGRGIPM